MMASVLQPLLGRLDATAQNFTRRDRRTIFKRLPIPQWSPGNSAGMPTLLKALERIVRGQPTGTEREVA
jgi:hypothetical protein